MLDYTIQPFQLVIGDLDVTQLLTRFEISRPFHEKGQNLCWTGNFTLQWSPDGTITESQLSHQTNPAYFRPYQKACVFSIRSYSVVIFYIDDYKYNIQTRIGEGRLIQILDVPKSRQSQDILPVLNQYGTSLGDVIYSLINAAFQGSSFSSPATVVNKQNHTGTIDDHLTSRDPAKDAQEFASKNYRWLFVDTQNRINDVSGDPLKNPIIFSRSFSQVEIQPSLDHIHFAASKVIVTGSKKQIRKNNTGYNIVVNINSGDGDTVNNFTDDGKRLRLVTNTYKKKWEVFPELCTQVITDANGRTSLQITDTSDILFERKVVEYKYWQVNPPYERIETFIPDNTPDRNTVQYLPQVADLSTKFSKGQLVQTVTTIQRITGAVYPQNAGTPQRVYDSSLTFYEKTIETDWCKILYRPKGLIDLTITGDANIVPDTSPVLVFSEPIKGGRIDPDGTVPEKVAIDPGFKFEYQIPVEDRQQAPILDLEQIVLKGEANFKPVGWTPFRNDPYIEDLGFIPSQDHANMLALQIGQREIRRRDSWEVILPVPLEWLQSGCLPLSRTRIGNLELQIDNEILSLENGQLKYSFVGNQVGTLPQSVAEPPQNQPYIPGQTLYLTTQSYVVTANQSVNFDLTVLGGTAPYTFSVSGLVSGLSLSGSGNLSGQTTIAGINISTVTVTDSLSNTENFQLTIIVVSSNPSSPTELTASEWEIPIYTDAISEFISPLYDGISSDGIVNSSLIISLFDGVRIDAGNFSTTFLSSNLTDGIQTNGAVSAGSVSTLIDGVSTDVLLTSSSFTTSNLSDGIAIDVSSTVWSVTAGTPDGIAVGQNAVTQASVSTGTPDGIAVGQNAVTQASVSTGTPDGITTNAVSV